jgi:hypothetical protein
LIFTERNGHLLTFANLDVLETSVSVNANPFKFEIVESKERQIIVAERLVKHHRKTMKECLGCCFLTFCCFVFLARMKAFKPKKVRKKTESVPVSS